MTPEQKTAAQYQALKESYAYQFEVQLATLEQLVSRKRSSKTDIERQADIVEKMFGICRAHEIEELARMPTHWAMSNYGRVREVFDQGVDTWIEKRVRR